LTEYNKRTLFTKTSEFILILEQITKTMMSKTSPRLDLSGAMGPKGPKVPLELNNGALPHMAQRSDII
jgi:hypothetical protein